MVIKCGYLDPSLLTCAFPKELHGHGVTLVPLGALICVYAGALPNKPRRWQHAFLASGQCWRKCLARSAIHR